MRPQFVYYLFSSSIYTLTAECIISNLLLHCILSQTLTFLLTTSMHILAANTQFDYSFFSAPQTLSYMYIVFDFLLAYKSHSYSNYKFH